MEGWEFRALFATLAVYGLLVYASAAGWGWILKP